MDSKVQPELKTAGLDVLPPPQISTEQTNPALGTHTGTVDQETGFWVLKQNSPHLFHGYVVQDVSQTTQGQLAHQGVQASFQPEASVFAQTLMSRCQEYSIKTLSPLNTGSPELNQGKSNYHVNSNTKFFEETAF